MTVSDLGGGPVSQFLQYRSLWFLQSPCPPHFYSKNLVWEVEEKMRWGYSSLGGDGREWRCSDPDWSGAWLPLCLATPWHSRAVPAALGGLAERGTALGLKGAPWSGPHWAHSGWLSFPAQVVELPSPTPLVKRLKPDCLSSVCSSTY